MQVTCAGCATELTITPPEPDGWEAVTAPAPTSPGRTAVVVGERLTVRCPACGTRTVLEREVAPQ